MTFNTVWPNGAVSVRANTVPGQQNTAFLQSTLNINHFFNDSTVGSNFNGNHRFVQMPQNQVMGSPADVPVGASMDGVLYLKQASVTIPDVQGFYNSANGVYQFIPSYRSGTVMVSSSYTNLIAVPQNCYGWIFMFKGDNNDNVCTGFFVSGTTTVQSYCMATLFQGSSTAGSNLKFGNGSSASGLNIQVETQSSSSGIYNYRIVYWAI